MSTADEQRGSGREGESDDRWGEAVDESPDSTPNPGDLITSAGEPLATSYGYRVGMVPEPIVGPDNDSPLGDDEPEGLIPPSPLWAMKDRRHIQWHLLPSHDRHDRLRERLGEGDETVYAIDDGRHHVTLGRRVGVSPDSCEYCLVGRLELELYEDLRSGAVPVSAAFNDADELVLCGVVAEDEILTATVFDVSRFDDASEVPQEFLPGAPYIDFPEDLEITVD